METRIHGLLLGSNHTLIKKQFIKNKFGETCFIGEAVDANNFATGVPFFNKMWGFLNVSDNYIAYIIIVF